MDFNLMYFLLSFVPSMLMLVLVYILLQHFIKQIKINKEAEIKQESLQQILPQRLQAYERMSLFLERIKPVNLASRLNSDPNKSAKEYEYDLLKTIQQEWEHNLSMQIYMNPETWRLIHSTKNAIQNSIRQHSQTIADEDSANNLQATIIQQSKEDQKVINASLLQLQVDIQGVNKL